MVKQQLSQHSTRAMQFAVVGIIGFIVDASILTLLFNILDYNLYASRLCSFACATIATWLLNRLYTFRAQIPAEQSKGKEYSRYLIVQTGGALLNLLVFVLVIWLVPQLKSIAVIPLAIGAFFGLVFNYTGSHYWVYTSRNVDTSTGTKIQSIKDNN